MIHVAEILLEKYYNLNAPAINDFDAVFSSVTRSNVSHIIYCQYDYMVNIKDPIQVTDHVYFQLLNVTRSNDKSKNMVTSIKIKLFADDDGNITHIKDYIKRCREEFLTEKSNKLGQDIYYFDHDTRVIDNKSSMNVSFTKKPFHTNKTFDNVFFTEKTNLEERVNHFLNNRSWYEKRGIPYTLGFMMYGPPGCGKTSTIKAIANLSKRHVFNVRLSDVKTNTQLKNLFQSEYVQVVDPVNGTVDKFIVPIHKRLYIIEDIDCMTDVVKRRDLQDEKESYASRGGSNPLDQLKELASQQRMLNSVDSDPDAFAQQIRIEEEMDALRDKLQVENVDAITLDGLLNILDGTYEIPDRMICITTNDPNIIDPALIRPGRIDMTVLFSMATKVMVRDMFCSFYEKEFEGSAFSKIKDYKISPATIHQILFKHFNNPNLAIEELIVLSNKRVAKKTYTRS